MNYTDYFHKLESDPEYKKAKAALKLHFALGDAVLRARLQRNWTQSELARRVGTKQANISRIEAGLGNPTIKLIQKIIQVLGLEISFAPAPTSFSYNTTPAVEMAIPALNWPISQEGTKSVSHANFGGSPQ
jgi:transcriptional regulator with XRE-family HTH domain